MVKKLNLNAIRIDGGTQPRERINMEVVGDYAEGVKVGIEFPSVVVFHDGAEYWLADGFHRWHAHKQAGKASIDADVRQGSLDDAKLFASSSNGEHGLPRTNADKKLAVLMALAVQAAKDWSDTKVAQHCRVSVPFVSAIRRPEVAVKQQENRAASAARQVADRNPITPDEAAVGKPTIVPTPKAAAPEPLPDEGIDPLAELESAHAEIEKLTAEIQAAEANDQKAETLKWRRSYEHAQRQQSEAMDRAKSATDREGWTMKQLRRCGKAVGEDDPKKIAAAVESAVRKAKEVA